MIHLLDELTEIPFQIFWDKWQELKPGNYNRERAEQTWFYMHENDRIESFKALSSILRIVKEWEEPYQFLINFKAIIRK